LLKPAVMPPDLMTKKRILILHPDVEELASMRQLLVKSGFEVITASNWDTAVRLASGLQVDYVLMDAAQTDWTRKR
jgi:PleD family two-component response regulator